MYGAAIVVLFVLYFTGRTNQGSSAAVSENDTLINRYDTIARQLKIAFVNTDTILSNYTYYKEQTSALEKDQVQAEKNYTAKLKKLEEDYKNYMYKINLGLMKQADAEREFAKKQEELEAYRARVSNTLIEKQEEIASRLYDSILVTVERYNKTAGYTYIITHAKGSNLLYADHSLDLTDVILEELNRSYEIWSGNSKSKKKKVVK